MDLQFMSKEVQGRQLVCNTYAWAEAWAEAWSLGRDHQVWRPQEVSLSGSEDGGYRHGCQGWQVKWGELNE